MNNAVPKVVVCANVEVLCDRLGLPTCANPFDIEYMLLQWRDTLDAELDRAGLCDCVHDDARFNNWNGGRYDSQARAYGYQTRNVIAWRGIDDAIIDAALERAEQALVQTEMELHESAGGITPGEARILDRIARDAGIVGD